MKKICLLILLLSMFMLSSCSNENLANAFFDNEKSDEISVLWEVIHEYDTFVHNVYEQS